MCVCWVEVPHVVFESPLPCFANVALFLLRFLVVLPFGVGVAFVVNRDFRSVEEEYFIGLVGYDEALAFDLAGVNRRVALWR